MILQGAEFRRVKFRIKARPTIDKYQILSLRPDPAQGFQRNS